MYLEIICVIFYLWFVCWFVVLIFLFSLKQSLSLSFAKKHAVLIKSRNTELFVEL